MSIKTLKKRASKVAHNRPRPLYFTAQPRPQPTAQNWFFILRNLGTRHLFSYMWQRLGGRARASLSEVVRCFISPILQNCHGWHHKWSRQDKVVIELEFPAAASRIHKLCGGELLTDVNFMDKFFSLLLLLLLLFWGYSINTWTRRGTYVHYGNTGCGVFKRGVQN